MAFCAHMWQESAKNGAHTLYMAVLFRGTIGRVTGKRARNNGPVRRNNGRPGSRILTLLTYSPYSVRITGDAPGPDLLLIVD